MNIPDKVKIGGHILNVVLSNNGEHISDNAIGTTTLGKNIIYLNSNYPESRQEEALLHEIIHNCLYDLQEEQNESLVTRLGTMLYAIINDNYEIFKGGETK